MALYHFTLDQISRSKGHTAVGAAAYRAGEKIYDDYYGVTQDYSRKQGVIYSEIMLPPNVPERLQDRQTLWNEVETIENHPKAQLAHSFEFALQNELTMEENIVIARKFVQENFLARGMIVDMAVHDPPRGDPDEPGNPHVHVICPIRPLNEHGEWGAKQRREYLKDEQGNPILDKKGKPKFRAVPTTDWSDKETLKEYRKNWCDLVNAAFEEKGVPERIDHRSYQEQDVDLIPTIHEGVAVRQMEAKGISTEKRALNNLIRYLNRLMIELRKLVEWSQNKKEQISREIEKLENPTLIELLQNYYDERNAVAESYPYGTRKAQLYNLKEFAETIAFMESKNITKQEELDGLIAEAEQELKPVKQMIVDRTERLKEVQNLIRMSELYQKTLPIHSEYVKKRFGKKRFYEEHHKELTQYQMSHRIVTENLDPDGRIPMAFWKKEERELLEQQSIDGEQKADLTEKLKRLQKIRTCVDAVLNPPTAAADSPVPKEPSKKQTEKKKVKERTSILAALEEKKTVVKERDAMKNQNRKRRSEPEL